MTFFRYLQTMIDVSLSWNSSLLPIRVFGRLALDPYLLLFGIWPQVTIPFKQYQLSVHVRIATPG